MTPTNAARQKIVNVQGRSVPAHSLALTQRFPMSKADLMAVFSIMTGALNRQVL
jgi:hypothetical protein